MKVALCVNKVTADIGYNIETILDMITKAVNQGAKFIVFPETCITGLINNDIPIHDRELATDLYSKEIEEIKKICKAAEVSVVIGIFELSDQKLYDSVLLFSPAGEVVFTQRRISRGWFSNKADLSFYGCSEELDVVNTCLGRTLFLICGDLFDDSVVEKASLLNPDWIIYPFARAFDSGHYDQKLWDEDELPEYSKQILKVAPNAMMVNYLSDINGGGYFGGAFVFKNGKIISRK